MYHTYRVRFVQSFTFAQASNKKCCERNTPLLWKKQDHQLCQLRVALTAEASKTKHMLLFSGILSLTKKTWELSIVVLHLFKVRLSVFLLARLSCQLLYSVLRCVSTRNPYLGGFESVLLVQALCCDLLNQRSIRGIEHAPGELSMPPGN